MTPAPPPRIGSLLRMLFQVVQRKHLDRLAEQGFDDVRPSHWPVLQYPGPAGFRPSELAARSSVSKQSLNHVLRDLERLRYIALVPEPADSRARLIELTERGDRLMEALFAAGVELELRWSAELSDGDFDALRRSLAELYARVGADEERLTRRD